MYRENFINSLRAELLNMVTENLSPVAMRYGYSEVPLETNIKWRPQVLVLGNYSSGKSTLINELLETKVQATGQAPTDDSFTVITYDDNVSEGEPVRVTEARDGKFLLNDPEFPYESLKKHGQRFTSHFRLKKVNSPFLKNLAIIDTPGMLDSITERDRGYKYQEVIGDFAQLADLVLILFDPHKAGTVREAHESLRDTLPTRTFEDRILFVLNRIDECASLIDLLQVYGTLCWNLSQMTGRKDIPTIHLTYSPHAMAKADNPTSADMSFLHHLDNQRAELKKAILQAPRHRLDHLATFVETHSERLGHMLEALLNFRRKMRRFSIKYTFIGLFLSLLAAAGIGAGLFFTGIIGGLDPSLLIAGGSAATAILFLLWSTVFMKGFRGRFYRKQLASLDDLTDLENQTRRDSWQAVAAPTHTFLEKSAGRFSLQQVKRDFYNVRKVFEDGTREIREALNELAGLTDDTQDTPI
jgi:GTPase SAR1 family protein